MLPASGSALSSRLIPWLVSLIVLCVTATPAWSAETVEIQWRFDAPGEARGWVAGGHIRNWRVADGALRGESHDSDPILVGPVFEIRARPTQSVEVKMCTPHGGAAQLFWTETLQGKYGGFSQQKSCAFTTESTESPQVYRIDPFWHAAGKVIRLRLDPPATGEFAIEWIRVVDRGAAAQTTAQSWRFTSTTHDWRTWRQASPPQIANDQLVTTTRGKSAMLISPPLSVQADPHPYVSLRMAVQRGTSGRLFCVSSSRFGAAEITFPLRPDGQLHSYNIDVGPVSYTHLTLPTTPYV
jgi:hypothetical protein